MRWGTCSPRSRRAAAFALAGLLALAAQAMAAPLAGSFSEARPVTWVSVAAGQPDRVWAESAAGGFISGDGGRSFRAPLATRAFQRAQVAQASLLADGRTLLAMPTVWSTDVFTPPRWSEDDGATWHAGALRGEDARYDFGAAPGFVGESPVTPDPTDPRTAWFCQGNLYVTHDAGRTWTVGTLRLKRPWHCAALAIAPGKQHTLILLAQGTSKNPKKVPGRLLRSVDGGATWTRLKAPRYPQLDYNGRTIAFDPTNSSTALMVGAHETSLGTLYRSVDAGLSWKRVRPAGALRGAVVEQFAFAGDGAALALVRLGDRQRATFVSRDGGLHWGDAPSLEEDAWSAFASPLAASGDAFLLGTNQRGFWRLAPAAERWAAP